MDTGEESFEDDNLGVQAFQVESDDDDLDLNMPPTTGNQYLRRVRQEANTCPKVVVADVDRDLFRKKQTVHVREWIGAHQRAPQGFAPSLKWQNLQVANFAQQRQNFVRYKAKWKRLKVTKLPTVPHHNDIEAWCRLCFGRLKPPSKRGPVSSSASSMATVAGLQKKEAGAFSDCRVLETETKPVNMDLSATDLGANSVLSESESNMSGCESGNDSERGLGVAENISQGADKSFPVHEGILPLVSVMLAMDQTTVLKVLEYHLNWFEVTGFTERQGYWFYALLVCLDKPLLPDACALLRELARACSRLRASLESKDDPKLPALNLFICLIARYFDQSDLKDQVT
ncbi:gem-associated protein 2-like isoform X2 [Dreissena polymorpha]|uniref:Gem-associated protein 2 n=3 Tax=Dreissena polymorpha TaxID=45954 RepID=A0A9D4CBX9_DREPO|nr:gem-associated protein 2-like isoform X2 [Dreissena polymorpha]KAH3720658.1 hypothetical protein DPMN_063561 [Dreissena polymorpha]